ncbi:hypothetical protein [Burkholderia sp. BCC0322]|uniref:hypothetical protein n=1 Tax=unclassified Burkholderia TaxID=2613784 RepID=UPI00158C0BB4|nr:hypothetical protein [Burkholderia sp. BCC0322]
MTRWSYLTSVAVTVLMSACAGPSSKHDEVLRPPGDPEVQAVLAEIAGSANHPVCDPAHLKMEIAEATRMVQQQRNLDAFDQSERLAASFAFCGPQRKWELATTSEFVGGQLAVAVLMQSRLPEQQRNHDAIERDMRRAGMLLQYARQSPGDRSEAEQDWRILERGRQALQRANP